MGVNISVASPLPDGTTLENYNGSWRVLPEKLWTEVYSYSIPEALGSASSFAITGLTAPTFDNDYEYRVYIKTTGMGAVGVPTLGVFTSAQQIRDTGEDNGSIHANDFNAGVTLDAKGYYKHLFTTQEVNGPGFVRSGLGTSTSLNFTTTGATAITTLTLKVFARKRV